jgi:hypothetical protein
MRWSNCSDASLENALRPGNILRFQAGMFPADVWLLLADFSRSIFRNRAEQEMRAIVVNLGREVTMYRVAGGIQVRHHY